MTMRICGRCNSSLRTTKAPLGEPLLVVVDDGGGDVEKILAIQAVGAGDAQIADGDAAEQAELGGVESDADAALGEAAADLGDHQGADGGGVGPGLVSDGRQGRQAQDGEDQTSDQPFPPGHAHHPVGCLGTRRFDDGPPRRGRDSTERRAGGQRQLARVRGGGAREWAKRRRTEKVAIARLHLSLWSTDAGPARRRAMPGRLLDAGRRIPLTILNGSGKPLAWPDPGPLPLHCLAGMFVPARFSVEPCRRFTSRATAAPAA